MGGVTLHGNLFHKTIIYERIPGKIASKHNIILKLYEEEEENFIQTSNRLKSP